MADPRQVGPQQRSANHSPLMAKLVKRSQGEVVNECPFGCTDEELDDNGYCGHLIGFYSQGTMYEPRIRRKKDGRIIVSGAQKKPMEKGFRLVRITTSARVYSPRQDKSLVVTRDEYDKIQNEILAKERELLKAAETLRNPVLEGEWGQTDYDKPVAAAATPAT